MRKKARRHQRSKAFRESHVLKVEQWHSIRSLSLTIKQLSSKFSMKETITDLCSGTKSLLTGYFEHQVGKAGERAGVRSRKVWDMLRYLDFLFQSEEEE